MASCEFLYTIDDASLPARLPTVEEIESATEVLSSTAGRKVVGVGDNFVVKYGMQVKVLEGETMLFLGQATTVPLPHVYALFRTTDQNKTYIVMERIKGITLLAAWHKMDQASKEIISSKLRSIVEDMRKLETPGGYCSVGGRNLPDNFFWTGNPLKQFSGPFDTEADLNSSLAARYASNGLSRYKVDYYLRTFEEVYQGHAPVFSHADLQRKNIMLRDPSTTTTGESLQDIADQQLVIVDWEFAGWYPSYWEYAKAMLCCGRWDDDWSYWVDRTLKPFRNEYIWLEKLFLEMWS